MTQILNVPLNSHFRYKKKYLWVSITEKKEGGLKMCDVIYIGEHEFLTKCDKGVRSLKCQVNA